VVTERLLERLSADDVAQIERSLDPEEVTAVANATPENRKRLRLAFGVAHRIPAVLAKTSLSTAVPREDVHSMGRGPLAAGGSPYYADLVVDAVTAALGELCSGQRGLDFGCSSGRVVRVLTAAYPEVEWEACDPIESSIAWARSNLAGVRFEVSPVDPPLPYDRDYFDFVFAISIWSHFSDDAALRWFAEMGRVVRPGGALVITTHGNQSIAHESRLGRRSPEQLAEIRDRLFTGGYWFAPEFGERGDHGLVNPDWGTAFLTPEWLLSRLTPRWHFVAFSPGRAEANQDVIVLVRAK
jgi:SAM-dependent methyltransferase